MIQAKTHKKAACWWRAMAKASTSTMRLRYTDSCPRACLALSACWRTWSASVRTRSGSDNFSKHRTVLLGRGVMRSRLSSFGLAGLLAAASFMVGGQAFAAHPVFPDPVVDVPASADGAKQTAVFAGGC